VAAGAVPSLSLAVVSDGSDTSDVRPSMLATFCVRELRFAPTIRSTHSPTSPVVAIGMTFWRARDIARAVGNLSAGSFRSPRSTKRSSSGETLGANALGAGGLAAITLVRVCK